MNTLEIRWRDRLSNIILNHPPGNIIDFTMMGEFSTAIEGVAAADFLLISSALDRFSNGVDVRIHTPELAPEMLRRFHQVLLALYHFEGISICSLNGHALGGALELAMACDLVVADPGAHLGFPEIRLACYPPAAAVLLPRFAGRAANRMLMLGETIDAEEARQIGLVDKIIAVQDLQAFLDKIQAMSSDALRALKRVLRKTSGTDFERALEFSERTYLEELLKSADPAEGVAAFLEKRAPRFSKSKMVNGTQKRKK